MEDFVALINAIDATTRTNKKLAALQNYFQHCDRSDAAWAIFYLSGKRLKRPLKTAVFKEAAQLTAQIPQWLFEECYHIVGDLSETVALLMPPSEISNVKLTLTEWIETIILPIKMMDEEQQRLTLQKCWRMLPTSQHFVWNKLLTGHFRIGVSAQLIYRALSAISGVSEHLIARRLMGDWQPSKQFMENLFLPETSTASTLQPVPLMLSYALTDPLESLIIEEWNVEWKWDGIRAQALIETDAVHIWSRGEELITERFPEITLALTKLSPGTLIDGEILAWDANGVMPFQELQKRIGRKTITKKMLQQIPCILIAFDILYYNFLDLRAQTLIERRKLLENLLSELDTIKLSALITNKTPAELIHLQQRSRHHGAEGFMLKRKDSPYVRGRKRGLWWKWKIDPMTIDAVLVQAQRGHGRRANLYSDYTFAVWRDNELVSFAKAYSGLSDEEMDKVDSYVKKNTLERFGPVVLVKPELVFEIAFEGIQLSKRHKSGIAVRFPRILRWRHDKTIEEANTLNDLHDLLKLYERNPSSY